MRSTKFLVLTTKNDRKNFYKNILREKTPIKKTYKEEEFSI